ncbi:MAG: NACHT domain-containing protein [Leptolyngbyaceae cyanobacterium]
MTEPTSEIAPRRQRGAILSSRGITRLRAAIRVVEKRQFEGRRLNLQELGNYIRIAPKTVRKVLKRQSCVDLSTLELCFSAFQVPLQPDDLDYPRPPAVQEPATPAVQPPLPRTDWGTAPDGDSFYGREQELHQLTQWVHLGCRVLTVLGQAGVGKTALVAQLARQIAPLFDVVIWRSLRQVPPPELLLQELVTFSSGQQSLPPTLATLMQQLRHQRCLVVLDNFDAVLQAECADGQYRPNCELYSDLLQAVGGAQHASCLIITSREQPVAIATTRTVDGAVRLLPLTGSVAVGQGILAAKGLIGSEAQQQRLSQQYDHNPLVLKIIAASIHDLYGGDLELFLAQEVRIFGGVRWLLDKQFQRLSELERSLCYWLTINREGTRVDELVADLLPAVPDREVLQALETLHWRSLVEHQGDRYSQLPVIMDYVLEQLLDGLYNELVGATSLPQLDAQNCSLAGLRLPMISRYALVKTTVRDYIRQVQVRLILQPLVQRLRRGCSSLAVLEQQLQTVLNQLRPLEQWAQQGYGTGNCIDLLSDLGVDLTGYDFSGLPIWQAYLQATPLHRVKFNGAHFHQSRFADVFGIVLALSFSPDGECLAMGDSSGTVRLHRITDLQTQLLFRGHSSRVMSISWSPDGQRLASASMDGSVGLWNVGTGQAIATLVGHQNLVMSVSWHPNGLLLATGSEDHTVRLWEASTGAPREVWRGHTDSVRSVCFSPDGQTLASASADGSVRLWAIATGESHAYLGHSDSLWAVDWSPDGRWIASGGEDGIVCLWQPQADRATKILHGHTEWIWDLQFSPDSRSLASGSRDRSIRLWEVATGNPTKVWDAHPTGVSALCWHPQQPLLASGGIDQVLRLWDTRSGHSLMFLQGYTTSVWSVAWSPIVSPGADSLSTGRPALVSGHQDGSLWLWGWGPGVPRRRLKGHQRQVWQVAWCPDGERLASSGEDGWVHIWNVSQGNHLHGLRGHHHDRIWTVAWSPDGNLLASGGADAAICLWHPVTQYCLQSWQAHASDVMTLQFSPDGQWLASGSEDQTLRLWNLTTGELGLTLAGHQDRITQLQFNPRGTLVVSASEDRTIRLWQVASGECLGILQGHNNRVWSVQFSPDGQKLVSVGTDRTVRIWDVSTHVCETVLTDPDSLLWTVGWSADGTTLAIGGEDGTGWLWSVPQQQWIDRLKGDRLYEGMQLQGATGLSQAASVGLQKLGAHVS